MCVRQNAPLVLYKQICNPDNLINQLITNSLKCCLSKLSKNHWILTTQNKCQLKLCSSNTSKKSVTKTARMFCLPTHTLVHFNLE